MQPGLYHIRWRSHEFLLVTIVILVAIGGYLRPFFEMSAGQLIENYGRAFTDAHLSFDYYFNVIFPKAGFLILLYGCYCWMNLYIIPYFLRGLPPAKPGPYFLLAMRPRRIIWCLVNVFLLAALLGIGWGDAFSYLHFPDIVNNHLSGAMVIGMGIGHTVSWVTGYIGYAAWREIAIRRMEADQLKYANWITVTNQAAGFFLLYYALGAVLANFYLFGDPRGLEDFYFLILPPVILTVYTNLYWVLPIKGEGKLLRGWNAQARRRLLISTAGWPIPFMVYGVEENKAILPVWFAFWLTQLAVTTPISWMIWRQRKDKLLQVRGLQTALGQSEADLLFLRSQINPHFLFNVLNTLYGTALQEGAGRTAEGVQKLGDMMRFMLHENHLAEIPMSKEIEYLRNYIALQELRTESAESIRIEANIDETFPEYRIAPMLLIPFVENSFKHGISLREPSWIKLQLYNEGNRILFEIRNSVHARKGDDPEKARSGIGLKNVLHRLKLFYPNRHEFYMHQDEKEFFVQLTLQP
ncbi:MAG TPA: histidine kinase [Puia sp.]|nr:histidine kinase [Puia sp.]